MYLYTKLRLGKTIPYPVVHVYPSLVYHYRLSPPTPIWNIDLLTKPYLLRVED